MNIINNFEESRSGTNLYAWVDDIFNDDELIEIIKYSNNLEFIDGKVEKSENNIINDKDGVVNVNLRKSKINFIYKNNYTDWIFDKLNNAILYANLNFFNFDLIGYDFIQYTKYSLDEYYHSHADLSFGINDNRVYNAHARKLSASLILNDNYTGGDLRLYQGLQNPTVLPVKKGRCYFFPSFVVHEIAPVTSGERHSLVAWIMGPRWK
jgi:PKHD-type hydroxylase